MFQRFDPSVRDRDQMRKGNVQGPTVLLATAAIAACHQQAAVGEIEEAVRFGARFEMPGDRAPGVAAHGGRTVVITADAERHSLGGTSS